MSVPDLCHTPCQICGAIIWVRTDSKWRITEVISFLHPEQEERCKGACGRKVDEHAG